MKVTWIGQSGYILKSGSTEIMLDPYLSDAVNMLENRPRLVSAPIKPEDIHAGAVICTHNHMDHLDTYSAALMPKNTHFITTAEGRDALYAVDRKNVSVLFEGDSISVGDFEITAVYAKHTAEAFGAVIRAEGKTLYFSGDTLFNSRLFEISRFKPDIAFICINGKLGNMNVKEAVITAGKIGAAINIPNHYGMFATNTEDPHRFADFVIGGTVLEFNREYDF